MKILSLRFSRAWKSYDQWAVPQRECAKILKSLELLSGRVLDLGCGTGIMSEDLSDVVGIDIAHGMAKAYRERFGRVVVGDAHCLPFRDKSFDHVVSNFALHWTDTSRSLQEVLRVCRSLFLCAMPVEGSLPELHFPFPKAEEIEKFLRGRVVFRHYFTEIVDIPFSGWDLVRFFHYTGSSYNPVHKGGIISRKMIEKMLSSLQRPYFKVLFLSCEVI